MLCTVDGALRTVFGRPTCGRRSPADGIVDNVGSEQERRLAGRLMRVNHAGEVCAQALYQGQALTAREPRVRSAMEQSSEEENDHLAWCAQRLTELDAHTSILNPLWYAGSFTIGAAFGAVGDKWSLGFLAETERQVVKHLERHLARLPDDDAKSRAILEQMRVDEQQHATTAVQAGAATLPDPIPRMMGLTARIMTGTAEYL